MDLPAAFSRLHRKISASSSTSKASSSAIAGATPPHEPDLVASAWNSADLTFPELAQIQQARRAWLNSQKPVYAFPAQQPPIPNPNFPTSISRFNHAVATTPSFLTEPYTINANELASMQDFFQAELHENRSNITGNPPLFDPTETQFLSNFLDGFLNESSFTDDSGAYNNMQQVSTPFVSFDPRSCTSNLLHAPQPSPNSTSQFYSEMPINSSSALFVQQTGEFHHDYYNQQQQYPMFCKVKHETAVQSVSPPASSVLVASPPVVSPASTAICNSMLVPGTVPVPVIAPRKKRHRSKDLLSEVEKRANHIASEQKRRRNIRMGFKALTMLIPSLRPLTSKYDSGLENSESEASEKEEPKKKRKMTIPDVGPSKSIVLSRTIEHLEFLMEREEVLGSRLRKLQLAKTLPNANV